MKNAIIVACLILLFGLMSCHSENASEAPYAENMGLSERSMLKSEESSDVEYRQATLETRQDKSSQNEILPGEKIIKTANIGLRLETYDKDIHKVYSAVKANGGYISEENEQRETYRVSNDLVIRVPNKDFDKLIESLTQGEGVKNIEYKRIRAEDVGEEYTDIEARLRSKKAVEEQYYEILKKAKSIPDILAVNEQIRKVREEIDAHLGRLKYLQNRIGHSTIYLNVYEEFDESPIERPGFWNKLKNSLQSGWNGALGFILVFVNLWPLWLGIIVLIYIIRRIRRRWRNRKSS